MANTSGWRIGWKKNPNGWNGAAVALGAGDGLLLRSESLPSGIPEREKDMNIGQTAPSASYFVAHNHEGQLGELAARYEGVEKPLAMVLGSDVVTEPNSPTETTTKLHTMDAQPTNDGKVATVAKDTGIGDCWEYPTVKASGFELKLAGRIVVIAPKIIANKLVRGVGNGAVNDDLVGAGVTPASSKLAMLFNSSIFRINQFGDAALAGGDLLYLNDFSLGWDRNQKASPVNRADGTPDEPESDGGEATGTLSVTFPNMAAALEFLHTDNLDVAVDEQQAYKADLDFVGPTIPSSNPSTPYRALFEMPKLVLNSYEAAGPGPIARTPVKVEFDVLQAETAPAGMTWGVNIPLRAKVWNQNATAEV